MNFLGNLGPTWTCNQCWPLENCMIQMDLSNKVLCASNKDHMPKLRPREVDVLIYPKGAHSFRASSPRVKFLDV